MNADWAKDLKARDFDSLPLALGLQTKGLLIVAKGVLMAILVTVTQLIS
jgi:hypothetical protein